MENKKYRTFEIVDGKIKITNAISKFMRFVYGTCFFTIDSPKNSEEFMKRCEVIGYLFSGDYSKKKMNVLLYNNAADAGSGKSVFITGITDLLVLYHSYNGYHGVLDVPGRDISIPKRLDMLSEHLRRTQPSFIHINDMKINFDFEALIHRNLNLCSMRIARKHEIDDVINDYIPIIISTNVHISRMPQFKNGSTQRRFYTLNFSPYYVYNSIEGEFGVELFGKDYSTLDYAQDLVFCLDCLDFYNDLNSYY